MDKPSLLRTLSKNKGQEQRFRTLSAFKIALVKKALNPFWVSYAISGQHDPCWRTNLEEFFAEQGRGEISRRRNYHKLVWGSFQHNHANFMQ